MKCLLPVLLATIGPGLLAQAPIRLLVRSDDMGMSHAVNYACMEVYREGISRSVEVMAVTPWFPEAVQLLSGAQGFDAGLHLTFTSEWENLKWRPLTTAPSLTDANGHFFPFVLPKENFPCLMDAAWKLSEMEAEARAQIELALRNIPQLSHVSAHMGFTHMNPSVDSLIRALAVEYKLDIFPDPAIVKPFPQWSGADKSPGEKIFSLIAVLESLEPGVYLLVEHPGYDTPEMQGVGHQGYEQVSQDREGVTRAFTDPRVRAVIARRGIELISYRDLK